MPNAARPLEQVPQPPGAAPGAMRTPMLWYLAVLVLISALEWIPVLAGMALQHHSLPYRSPLFDPAGRYDDWNNFVQRTLHFGEPGMLSRRDLGLPYPYPLPSIWIFILFEHLVRNTLALYLLCGTGIFLLAAAAFSLHLRRIHAGALPQIVVWATLLLGSPALFLLDRANIEVFLWLLLLGGVVSFVYQRPYLAATFFALAAAMKIYPALLLLLFVPRRQGKALLFGIGVAAAATLVSLQVVGPNIPAALGDMAWGAVVLRKYQIVALAENSLRFDHSLFGFAKQSYFVLKYLRYGGVASPPEFPRLFKIYSVLAPLCFAVLYWFRLRTLPMLNQLCALVLLALLLPYVSYEYTLVHLYLCFGAFLLYLHERSSLPAFRPTLPATAIMLCFAVIFAPVARLVGYHVQAQVKCLALLVLLGLVLIYRMPSRLFGDSTPASPLGA